MCGVMRTVISCPSDLIWDESATSLAMLEISLIKHVNLLNYMLNTVTYEIS